MHERTRGDEKFIKLIEKVFFLAMKDGYAGKSGKSKIAEIPGSRAIPFMHQEGIYSFLVLDVYIVSKDSPYSSGMTIIYCDGQPVWSMNYRGFYDKAVIPLLKLALKFAYQEGIFNGGRGPRIFRSPSGTVYHNMPKGDFSEFSGREEITTGSDNGLGYYESISGWHEYSGGLMLPDDYVEG